MIPSFEDITCFLTARYASWKRSSSSRPCIETFSFSLSYMRLNHSLNSLRSLVAIIVCFLCETLRPASAGTLFSFESLTAAGVSPRCQGSARKNTAAERGCFFCSRPRRGHGLARRHTAATFASKKTCVLPNPFVRLLRSLFLCIHFIGFHISGSPHSPFAVTRTDTWGHVSAHPLHISILYISLWCNIKF